MNKTANKSPKFGSLNGLPSKQTQAKNEQDIVNRTHLDHFRHCYSIPKKEFLFNKLICVSNEKKLLHHFNFKDWKDCSAPFFIFDYPPKKKKKNPKAISLFQNSYRFFRFNNPTFAQRDEFVNGIPIRDSIQDIFRSNSETCWKLQTTWILGSTSCTKYGMGWGYVCISFNSLHFHFCSFSTFVIFHEMFEISSLFVFRLFEFQHSKWYECFPIKLLIAMVWLIGQKSIGNWKDDRDFNYFSHNEQFLNLQNDFHWFESMFRVSYCFAGQKLDSIRSKIMHQQWMITQKKIAEWKNGFDLWKWIICFKHYCFIVLFDWRSFIFYLLWNLHWISIENYFEFKMNAYYHLTLFQTKQYIEILKFFENENLLLFYYFLNNPISLFLNL